MNENLPEPAASLPIVDGTLWIESLDLESRGIAHREDGKVVFVEGALPFERVRAQVFRKKSNWEAATLTEVVRPSAQRVIPACPHFGLAPTSCGGCKMQHLEPAAQVAIKQRVLEDDLWHLSKVKAESILPPIYGPSWGYRYRARLSVRFVAKKEQVLIGFHERKSRYIADMQSCRILPPAVSDLLLPLRALIASLEARDTVPQIEVACGEGVIALVLRHLEPLSAQDEQALSDFAAAHTAVGVQWWTQAKGPDTIIALDEEQASRHPLQYSLPEYGVKMPFRPADFTQVNPDINRVLVARALRLLAVQSNERVIDWFCGLGNFTLPLATQAREVLGIEGSETLLVRARENAQRNFAQRSGIAATAFACRNLFNMGVATLLGDGEAEKWLIDPPREGALALVQTLAKIHAAQFPDALPLDAICAQDESAEDAAQRIASAQAELKATRDLIAQYQDQHGKPWRAPQRIVYVSCNPASLARDAGYLVHHAGYRCSYAGVINMFPHTAHVESMAVFEKID